MKILFITTSIPYPPNDGERVRSFNLLKRLAERHELFLFCLYDHSSELDGVAKLIDLGIVTKAYQRSITTFACKLKSVLFFNPLFVCNNYSKEMSISINKLMTRQYFDAVHIDGLPLIQYLKYIPAGVRIVFDLRDAWSLLYKRRVDRSSKFSKMILWYKWLLVKQYEVNSLHLPLVPLLLSIDDINYLCKLVPDVKRKLIQLPNGVDVNYFAPDFGEPEKEKAIVLFTGAMSYGPNKEAVIHFVTNIWPAIRVAVPNAIFMVVGKEPDVELLQFQSESINIIGEVPDIRPYLHKAKVVVCPLMTGAGIKNKVLEAMACGKVVVSTPVGVEGIRGINGLHYIVCDNSSSFAEKVIEQLSNKGSHNAISRVARAFVEKRFSWENSVLLLEKIYAGN